MKFVYLLDVLFIAAIAYHLALAPYTKVEESFNIQVIHDIINYGVYPPEQIELYDHKQFPGAVPRTFVGSLLIGGIVKGIDVAYSMLKGKLLAQSEDGNQLVAQYAARGVLGVANFLGLRYLRESLSKVAFCERNSKVKGAIGVFYTLFMLVQFHVPYYATRTLPNFIALPFVTFAFGKLVKGDMSGLTWLSFTACIFRVEIGVFAATISFVSSLIYGQSDIRINTFLLAVGAIVGVMVSVTVDSYFWGEWLWPEFESFRFNILHGKSVEWGVEPYGAYFKKYLLNFFRPPHVLLLAVLGLLVDPANDGTPTEVTEDNKLVVTHPARNSLRVLSLSSILYIAFMSRQPHKEWRFIVYVVPILTLQAANGMANITRKLPVLFAHKLLFFIMLASVGVSIIYTSMMSYASSFNYPGGEAVTFLDNYLLQNRAGDSVLVHMDVASCMSGVTKFTELHALNIQYDKTEEIEEVSRLWNNFTHLITEVDMDKQSTESTLIKYEPNHWKKLKTVESFDHVNFFPFVYTVQHIQQYQALPPEISPTGTSDPWDYVEKLKKFLRNVVVTKDYLYVYERTEKDAIPVYIKLDEDEPVSSPQEVPVSEPAPIDEDAIKDAINEEFDSFEDAHATVLHV